MTYSVSLFRVDGAVQSVQPGIDAPPKYAGEDGGVMLFANIPAETQDRAVAMAQVLRLRVVNQGRALGAQLGINGDGEVGVVEAQERETLPAPPESEPCDDDDDDDWGES